MVKICTARFNKNTLNENLQWKERRNKNKLTHCVYGSPSELKLSIKKNEWVIVLEMHNDINRIIGLGLIRNCPLKNNKIYSCGNYNRYTYEGMIRVDLSNIHNNNDNEISEPSDFTEEERIVIRMLELSLFYGQTHSKRAKGICELPSRISSLYDFKGCLKSLLLRCRGRQEHPPTTPSL
uniref:Uncharacterized protein n=1 Tax=viral metagenome TaxID=1070528 RepID=A0A6C0I3H8_9ZZZZ